MHWVSTGNSANDAGTGVRPPPSLRKPPTAAGLASALKTPKASATTPVETPKATAAPPMVTPTAQEAQKGWLAMEEAKATPGGGMFATPIVEPTVDSTVMGSVMESTVDTTD